MLEDAVMKGTQSMVAAIKYISIQLFFYFLLPYAWNYEHGAETLVCICLYTVLYAIYGEFVSSSRRYSLCLIPYLIYSAVVILLYTLFNSWTTSVAFLLLLPLYGLVTLIATKQYQRLLRHLRTQGKWSVRTAYGCLVLLLLVLKSASVSWTSRQMQSADYEKEDIIGRRDYLLTRLATTPKQVIHEMPLLIGRQFQGEWALYSCSMLSAALVNISHLYPDTRQDNLLHVARLIEIVTSPELRHYDAVRWNEDPLEKLDGDQSHVSYLSHLAWMISGYKELGGDDRYDELWTSVCQTMNRRILKSQSLNLPTYPGDSIYLPDMLVAIVSLKKYADKNQGKYSSTVRRWIAQAKKEWIDAETGLLVSFLKEDGGLYDWAPVKGSYAALSCYYLTLIDKDFARSQYEKLKSLYWKKGLFAGLKEYADRFCFIGLDIDTGPILFELSPSGTAFMTGSATFFADSTLRHELLTTAEIFGHTLQIGHKRHYLLSHLALVGESIMLTMRTHRGVKHKMGCYNSS